MADPEALVPRAAPAIDPDRLRALPLAAVDRFVLSLVDGATSVRDLAKAIDLGAEEVFASLLKLESLKLVVLSSSAPSPSTPRNDATPAKESVPKDRPSAGQPAAAPRAPAAARPAPSPSPPVAAPNAPGGAFVADAAVDLDPEHQRLIADLYDRLGSIDNYTLLGLSRTADKKEIKRAYFERTGRFHPDRFFRKKLGEWKLKMETVFGRMTDAHDILTSNEKRAEYDAYLSSVDKSRGIEQMLADALSEMKRAEDVVREVPVSSIPPPPSRTAPQSAPPPPSSAKSLEPPVVSSMPKLGAISVPRINVAAPILSTPSDDQTRREMLARRLTGSMRAPTAPKVPSFGYAKTEDAVGALKRRYEDRVSQARGSQAKKYADAGFAAKASGDMVAAANSLRVALSFDPENGELKGAYEESQRASDQLLAEQYLKQAEYEERSERWPDAGRSWQRVARARDTDAKAHERAAFCIVKASGDLHEASNLAQRAVVLQPKNAAYRVTLANVYLAAGLAKNAKRELEAAAQLAPDDANVAALLKRIAKPS